MASYDGAAIKTLFETLVDDSIDSVAFYQLATLAKDKVEGDRDWEMLKKLDSSQTASSAAKTLPTDYSRTLGMYVDTRPYNQIPFEQQKIYAFSALRWYLDFVNNVFYLIGTNLTGTINHFYIKTTPDITATVGPVWPSRFHPLIAFEMAIIYFSIDQGLRAFSFDDKWNTQYQLLKRAMIDWDASLQRRANENAIPPDMDIPVDIGLY